MMDGYVGSEMLLHQSVVAIVRQWRMVLNANIWRGRLYVKMAIESE